MTTPEKTIILALLNAVTWLAKGDTNLAGDAVTFSFVEEVKGDVELLKEIVPIITELRDEQQALVNGTAVSLTDRVADFDTVSAADWD